MEAKNNKYSARKETVPQYSDCYNLEEVKEEAFVGSEVIHL